MSYSYTNFKDRVVQKPLTYTKTENGDGSFTLTPQPGTITEAGTPINAATMKKMDLSLYLMGNIFTTAGSANVYTLTIGNITSLTDLVGMPIKVKFNVASTAASTLNINSYGAKGIKRPNGSDATSLKTGIYTLVYDGTAFTLQGEGGDVGKFPNTIKNGSLEYGQNCWAVAGGNVSFPSATGRFGDKSVYMTTTAGATTQYIQQAISDIPSGHKFYFSSWVWVEVYTSGQAPKIALSDYGTVNGAVGQVFSDPAKPNQWQFISMIGTTTTAGVTPGAFQLGAVGAACHFDGLMLIDLTDVFGAGKEPDKATMDALVQELGGWWDSSLLALTEDAWLDPAMLVQGYSGYDDGIKKDGTMPNRTFAANGGGYIEAVAMRADFSGNICTRPQTGYYLNEANGADFGPIIARNTGLTPAVIKKGAQVLNLVGAYNYASDFDIPGWSEQLLWEHSLCLDSSLYTRLSDGNIVFIGYDGGISTTYYQAVKINGDTGQTIWAVSIAPVYNIPSGGIIKTDQYDNIYLVMGSSYMLKIANNGTLSWVITPPAGSYFAGLDITSDGNTVLSFGGRNFYKINASTGTITTIDMTWLNWWRGAGGSEYNLRLMPDGTLLGRFWIDHTEEDDEYTWLRFDINGNSLPMGNFNGDSVNYKKCGSYYVYYDYAKSGIFRTSNADFSGTVKIATYSGSTVRLTMALPNDRLLIVNGLSYDIRDINGNLLKSSVFNRPDASGYWYFPDNSGRAIYPSGDVIWYYGYNRLLRKYKRGTYL